MGAIRSLTFEEAALYQDAKPKRGELRNCVSCHQDFWASASALKCDNCRKPRESALRPWDRATWKGKPLSRRESQIALLVSAGLTNKRIAEQLHVTEGYIKTLTNRAYLKTGCENRIQLMLMFLKCPHCGEPYSTTSHSRASAS